MFPAGSEIKIVPRCDAERSDGWVVQKGRVQFGGTVPSRRFIVTNLETDSRAVVRFYTKRRMGEQRRASSRENDTAELSPILDPTRCGSCWEEMRWLVLDRLAARREIRFRWDLSHVDELDERIAE